MASRFFDSHFASLEEAIAGIEIPSLIRETLALKSVMYISFDGKIHEGQLVVHRDLVDEVGFLFTQLFHMRFPIAQVVPVSVYGWDDNASMLANNTSAFNLRKIEATGEYSQHSYGWAIDINPMQNPCFEKRLNKVEPPEAVYDRSVPGTLTGDSGAVNLFRYNGWVWGGDWKSLQDMMHIQKRLDGKIS